MAETEAHSTFSIRIPATLAKQLQDRARLARRSRNSEIHMLLEEAIDAQVQKDLDLVKEMRERNHPT